MKIWHVPYRWLPRTFWENITSMYADVVCGIQNVFRWIPVIWFDRDWDWVFLAKVMQYKLIRMTHEEETCGHHVNSKKDAKKMLICSTILERLLADEYWENAVERFGIDTQAAKFSSDQSKSEMRMLGTILGKNLTGWWN